MFQKLVYSKGKVHTITGHKGREVEKLYRSILSLTSALGGVSGQCHAPAALHQGKENRHALDRRLGGPQGRSEEVRRISPPLGFCPRPVQPVASRYTD
jgi:hypothetical protein